MLTDEELEQRLRRAGVRLTPQRLEVARAVVNSTDHPSVQQIYDRLRQHLPSMTLATIYSTLGVLAKIGLVQELPFQKLSRYEANMEPHINLVCTQCHNVIDAVLGQESVVRLRDQVSRQANFEVSWQRVDFYGWCPRCKAEGRQVDVPGG